MSDPRDALHLRRALPADAPVVAECVEAAEQEARVRGHASLYLYTNEKMTENIAKYSRAGYVEYERRREQGFCRVFLRKVLG